MTTKTGGLALGLAVATVMALVPAAQAQQATELGTFNAWSAYTANRSRASPPGPIATRSSS